MLSSDTVDAKLAKLFLVLARDPAFEGHLRILWITWGNRRIMDIGTGCPPGTVAVLAVCATFFGGDTSYDLSRCLGDVCEIIGE
jgi:hypothetical protein